MKKLYKINIIILDFVSFFAILSLMILLVPSLVYAVSDPFPRYTPPPTIADFLPSPNNTYYCAPNGNNVSGNGTIDNPWYDLEGGRGTVVAGDLVYFRGGNYSTNGFKWSDGSENSLRTNGTSENPIVITNYPGEQVVYDDTTATAITLAGAHQKLIGTKIGNAYGWKITGGASFDNGADYAQVSGVEFIGGAVYGTNPAMLTYPHNTYNQTGMIISHNYFHDVADPGAGYVVCVRFFTTQDTVVEYNLFENNDAYQGGSVYFKDATVNATVRHNRFFNSSGGVSYLVQGNKMEGLEVYGNLSYGCETFIYFISDLANSGDINIYNNVALNLTSGFFYYLNADNQNWSEHGDIYNNVIDGPAFIRGWATTSSDPKNIPDLWDFNLWYSSRDRISPTRDGYFENALTYNDAVTFNTASRTVTVNDDYVGRNAGRNGTTIGGFTWGQSNNLPDESGSGTGSDPTDEQDSSTGENPTVELASSPPNLRITDDDSIIENAMDRVIVFSENFDDSNFSNRGWYDNTNLSITSEEHVQGSISSLEFHFSQNSSMPDSGGAMRIKFAETDEVFLSYYVKYSENWQGSNRGYHPHEFQFLTNKDSDYTGPASTYLTTYIEQNEGIPLVRIQDSSNIDESRLNQDLTNITEQRAVAGCNGDSDGYGDGTCYNAGSNYRNGKEWRADRVYFSDSAGNNYKNSWHFIEVYVKLNSISNNRGVADGVLKYSYDGQLIINHTDVMFRTNENADMLFNQFLIAPYMESSPVDQTFWIDNLKLETGVN